MKDYKAKFDYVAYYYVTTFVHRWNNKISHMRKRNNESIFVYDKFITEFIIYSSLVNVIKPQEYKHLHDCVYCTKVMAEFLVDRIDGNFISKLEIPANDLIKIVASNQFKVVSSVNKNPELEKNWNSNQIPTQVKALLETLYYLRCNLFHGEKEFSNEQVELLKPACQCLHIINNVILDTFADEFANHGQ